MSNSDQKFIRVFGKGQEETAESPLSSNLPVGQLDSVKRRQVEGSAATELGAEESEDGLSTDAPKVICEVYDYGSTSGTNVVTAGLFLDAVDEAVQRKDASVRQVFAAWEVDRFDLPKPCEVIEKYAAPTLDEVADKVLENTDPSRRFVSVRSWTRGAGRTTLAICMARRLAHFGKKVVLVDGDIDNPRLASQLGVTVDQGWESTLTGEVELSDCCVSSVNDKFSILPLFNDEIDIAEPAMIDRIRDLFTQLCGAFDVVLIDAGPGSQIWDHTADGEQLGIVVVQDRRRPDTDVDDLVKRMKRRSTSVLGLIENFSKAA